MINLIKLIRYNKILSEIHKSSLSLREYNVFRNRGITAKFYHGSSALKRANSRTLNLFENGPNFLGSVRLFSSKNTDGSDDDHQPHSEEGESFNPQLPATVAVPEVWPHVPVIAINKNIVFPRFIKLIELTNPQLIELIRRKVKLNQPYCGIFLKKKEDNEAEVVNNLDDVHNVGVFAQIHEMQDLGERLRLVVMAHRRIKLKGQILENLDDEPKGRLSFKYPHAV